MYVARWGRARNRPSRYCLLSVWTGDATSTVARSGTVEASMAPDPTLAGASGRALFRRLSTHALHRPGAPEESPAGPEPDPGTDRAPDRSPVMRGFTHVRRPAPGMDHLRRSRGLV